MPSYQPFHGRTFRNCSPQRVFVMSDTVPTSSEATAPVASAEPAAAPEVKDEATAKEESKPEQEAPKEENKPSEG